MSAITTFKGRIEKGRVKLLSKVNLPENAEVFVIVPENRPKFDLAEMAARMPKNYVASERGFGEPVGKEIW